MQLKNLISLALALGLCARVAGAAECVMPDCIAYPTDAGALNVRDYGAKGDGKADDTQAIIAALAASGDDTGHSPWHDRIVYLPNGTYLVSAPLEKHYADGRYASGTILIGQSREHTIIKLADGAGGYGDPDHPKVNAEP